ncbi:hypothetical protein CU669_16370 [Paramagnetospirillum kuznetsovii]|uniref:Haem-binding uptake Tiki superfamily ChaN domain-containing protein n=1 Tax=Paramagnetospirillum kuznetsovii TaxID=2053833 RepID=A0A364NVC0_9PROT|nr:ChaN family lipoprotein [Paramagnetospirillum kuznetsovii]RAU20845.1 hypothetical protein CU669_16370 [Paramagnetospirillum kuznetsovii]
MTITQAHPIDQPTRTLVRFIASALLCLFPLALAAAEPPPAPGLTSASPLAGRIWLPKERRMVSAEELAAKALSAGIVALGESHDNPDHHALQAWVVRRLVAAGRRPVAAFEMVDTDRQGDLDANSGDLAVLGTALDWEKRGWPDWSLYRPIAEAILGGGGGLVAANLPLATTRDIAKGKDSADTRARYGLDEAPSAAVQAAMAKEIRDGHCNLLPEDSVAPMVRVQRARDAALAEAVAMQATRPEVGPVVLIAGSGHVRSDRGAPARLRDMVPSIRILAVAFLEVDDTETDAAAASRFDGQAAPFDAVWFTGKAAREEPCAQMEKHLRKK